MSKSTDWIESAVSQVLNQLNQKDIATPKDVYVWNDGSVTGPKDNTGDRVEDLRLISIFSPDEAPTADEVRQSLENGMREANEVAFDEAKGVAVGNRPKELPGTPPGS
jgi:hypothetical protein